MRIEPSSGRSKPAIRRKVVRVATGQLSEPVHPVAERVSVDTEPLGRLAPATAGVEQPAQRLEQSVALDRTAEHSGDERLERACRQCEQQLERAQVAIR